MSYRCMCATNASAFSYFLRRLHSPWFLRAFAILVRRTELRPNLESPKKPPWSPVASDEHEGLEGRRAKDIRKFLQEIGYQVDRDRAHQRRIVAMVTLRFTESGSDHNTMPPKAHTHLSSSTCSRSAARESRPHFRRQTAPRALAPIHAQFAVLAHETEAARGSRPARNRELLHVFQHPRQPHDLRRRLATLRSEVWRRLSICVCVCVSICACTGAVGATDDVPFPQLLECAALMHAETHRGCLREHELRVELVPVQLVDEVYRARCHLEQRILGDLCARVDDVHTCWWRRRRRRRRRRWR